MSEKTTGMSRWIEASALVLVLALALALRWTTPTVVEDLRPRPDALEYEEGARNLRNGEGYNLIVEGRKYPPRYPPGLSLLLLPVLAVHDAGPGTGVIVVLASALGTVAMTWRLARFVAGPAGALIAAGLMALAPAHVRWSRAVMSDVPSSFVVAVLLVAMTALATRRMAVRSWSAIGLGIGLSTLLRPTNGLLAGSAALAAWLADGPRHACTRRLAWLALGVALGVAPLAAYNTVRFGSPLASGYDLWVPARYMAWRYVVDVPAGGGQTANLEYYGRALLGFGDLYPWPVGLLVAIGTGLAFIRRGTERGYAFVALSFVAPFLALHLGFFWQDSRFLVPLLPPLLSLAALPFGPSGPRSLRLSATAALVMGLAILGRSPQLYAPDMRFGEPTALVAIDRAVPSNAALLIRTNEAFFRRILRQGGADRLWFPLGFDDHQLGVRWHRVTSTAVAADRGDWIRQGLDARTAPRLVDAVLAEGRPVYLATILSFQVPFMQAMLATLGGRYALTPVARLPNGSQLLQVLSR